MRECSYFHSSSLLLFYFWQSPHTESQAHKQLTELYRKSPGLKWITAFLWQQLAVTKKDIKSVTWYKSIYQGFRCLSRPFGGYRGWIKKTKNKRKGLILCFSVWILHEFIPHRKHLDKKVLWLYCSELGHRHPWVQFTLLCAYKKINRCVLWGGKHQVTLNIE